MEPYTEDEMSKERKEPAQSTDTAPDAEDSKGLVESTDAAGETDTAPDAKGSKGPVKMRKTRRTKACYNCGKPVAPEDYECPHCKATGKSSGVNTGAYLRIALGFFLGLVLWAIFWK